MLLRVGEDEEFLMGHGAGRPICGRKDGVPCSLLHVQAAVQKMLILNC